MKVLPMASMSPALSLIPKPFFSPTKWVGNKASSPLSQNTNTGAHFILNYLMCQESHTESSYQSLCYLGEKSLGMRCSLVECISLTCFLMQWLQKLPSQARRKHPVWLRIRKERWSTTYLTSECVCVCCCLAHTLTVRQPWGSLTSWPAYTENCLRSHTCEATITVCCAYSEHFGIT